MDGRLTEGQRGPDVQTLAARTTGARGPRCSGGKPSAEKEPLDATLRMDDLTVSCKMARWDNEAIKIFQETRKAPYSGGAGKAPYSGGADFALPGVKEYQLPHGDMRCEVM